MTIGAPRMSATCSSSSVAPRAPWPQRMTVFFPELSRSAALASDSGWGMTIGGVQAIAVCPLTFICDWSSSVLSCQSL